MLLRAMADADAVVIRHHLQKLLSSEQMEKSEASRKLLCYLIERSLREESPKETEIAIDVFGRDASFNGADDSLVRVAVRTLRRKLSDYYAGPGRQDGLRFALPKGGYRVTFGAADPAKVASGDGVDRQAQVEVQRPAEAEPAARGEVRRRHSVNPWLIAAAVLLAGSVLLNAYLWPDAEVVRARERQAAVAASPLWSGIVGSDRPIMLVLGDLFMFTQLDPGTGRIQMVRDTAINSSEELRAFLAKNPPMMQDRGQRYMSVIQKSTALGMISVLRLVSDLGRHVEIRIGDEVQKEDLERFDIVYVGPLSRLGPLEGHYQLHSRFRFATDTLAIRDVSTGREFPPEGLITGQHKEYALVARFVGPTGNRIVILTPGSRNSGMLLAVHTLTSPEGLKQLETKLRGPSGELPESFEALLSVTSYGQTDLAAEILEAHDLKPRG